MQCHKLRLLREQLSQGTKDSHVSCGADVSVGILLGAYIVNTARGKLCDKDVIAKALEEGGSQSPPLSHPLPHSRKVGADAVTSLPLPLIKSPPPHPILAQNRRL